MTKHVKLNLGCGKDKRKGYINIDVDSRLKPDMVHDLDKPLPFENQSVSEIILQDILEHFTLESARTLLQECQRVLTPKGSLTVRVPNVKQIFRKYRSQPDLMMLFLYGDTTESGVWGAHKYGYTPEIFEDIACAVGLAVVDVQREDTNYVFALEKVSRQKPEIVFLGSGWRPSDRDLEKIPGKRLIVATDIRSYFISVFYHGRKIWCLSLLPSKLFGKVFLRHMSKAVAAIYVKDHYAEAYVRDILKFSHLRTK